MRVRVSGSGAPVVLIHGWAASGRVLEGLAANLEDDAYETHTLDLPGHGGSIAGRVDLSLDELTGAVIEYVGGLPAPPILIGWAMGALIALKVAASTPLRAGICIGTPSGGAEFGPIFEKMASRMLRDWPRYVRSSVDAIVGDRVSPEMHGFLVETMLQTPLPLARRSLLEVAASDPAGWARATTCPLLFVHGSEDKISPLEISRRLSTLAPQATLKTYEGVGHAPFLEDQARFLADVREFLRCLDD